MLDRWPRVKGNRWKERWEVGGRVGDTSTLLPFPPLLLSTGPNSRGHRNGLHHHHQPCPDFKATTLPAEFPYHWLQTSAFFPSSYLTIPRAY